MRKLMMSLVMWGIVAQAHALEKWRNPEVFRVNKEPAHAEFITYANRAEAIKPLDLSFPWNGDAYQNLNGSWDFNWYPEISAVPDDWFAPQSKVNEWGEIPVPGCWQTYGYDRLYYMNTKLPFWFDMNRNKDNTRPEFRGDARTESVKAGYVPADAVSVGCYRKWVEIPQERLNGRVVLRIGGVEAGVGVYVNGQEVGYSQDSMTPAEFNISPYLQTGNNLIALKVYRWTDGSYLEIQDMIRFNGIFRDVFLRFEPLQRIRDISFIGQPAESLKKVDIAYDVDVHNASHSKLDGAALEFELISNEDGKTVYTWSEPVAPMAAQSEVNISGALSLQNLKLWSPDVPNLYTLLASLKDRAGNILQVVRIDTGFRRFEDRDGNLFLNGQRFLIKGVNRHDQHPKLGRQVTLESMILDLEMMKRNNINTVRTSHYPNDERWYYLCNRYGMALLDEANVESHEVSFTIPQSVPQWIEQSVDRVVNMVDRDKNHPAVLIWSLGNEQGLGWCETFDRQYDRVKELDPTRLIMCDRGNDDVLWGDRATPGYPPRNDKPDTVTPMYGAMDHMKKHINSRDTRPFFMCEYRHAMGNAVGALKEVWDYIYANEDKRLNGGCIWDWVDQGFEATNENGVVYYQYGGDWNDAPTERNFCMNGLVLPDRGWTPKLAEVKKCYEPFITAAVDLGKGRFSVQNRLNQTDLNAFNISWELRENGEVVASNSVETLSVSPGQTGEFNVPISGLLMKEGKEYFLRIAYETTVDSDWAAAGHEITFTEFKLGGTFAPAAGAAKKKPEIKPGNGRTQIMADNGVIYTFDHERGALVSLRIGDRELLAAEALQPGHSFDFDIAAIDNYNSGSSKLKEFHNLRLSRMTRSGAARISVAEETGKAVVRIVSSFRSPKNAGFDEVQTWTIDGDGTAEVVESVEPAGALSSDVWLPRLGLRFRFSKELAQVAFYGKGPCDNYNDRSVGSWMGIHAARVADWYVPYPKPQDHGNREEVRWLQLSDKSGTGLKIVAPEPLSMAVLPYTQKELASARHTVDLPDSSVTELRVAARVSGVGNGSCGPVTEKVYQALSAPVEYRFFLKPILGEPVKQPNVLIIYGDDVGYGDVGVYGSEKIPTPNIDRLAAEGLQFMDGHCTAATCTPSRYSMLTGMYGFREGVGILPPEAPLCLPTDKLTLPKLFKQAGYTTGVIGKWHLGLGSVGEKADWNGDVKPGPLEVGFDYSYLLPVTNDRVPCVYLEGHRVVNLDPADPLYITDKPVPPEGFEGTRYPIGRLNEAAQTYYVADNQHASSVINGIARIGYQWGGKSALWNDETMADHFVDKAAAFIAKHKDEPFFLYFSSQDIHVPRAPHPRFQGTTGLGKRGDAMVQFDWTTGELMQALEESGLAENTIVIFSSDNGPVYDDGYADGSEVRKSEGEVDNGHDGSGPYSGGKYKIYEGGTRVPFIIRWPARVKPGKSAALVSHVDFIASFAELLNLELGSDEAPDSRDNLAALLGEDAVGLPFMPSEAGPTIALRRGPWKYIEYSNKDWSHKGKGGRRELFNLEEDIGEKNNVIDRYPEIAEEMKTRLDRIKKEGRIRE